MQRVRPGSVKIVDYRGTARLAPDLCRIGLGVQAFANRKRKEIKLFAIYNGLPDLTMWAPHKRANVRKIHLGRLLRGVGLEPRGVVGNEYKASVSHGVITIDLRKPLRRKSQ